MKVLQELFILRDKGSKNAFLTYYGDEGSKNASLTYFEDEGSKNASLTYLGMKAPGTLHI